MQKVKSCLKNAGLIEKPLFAKVGIVTRTLEQSQKWVFFRPLSTGSKRIHYSCTFGIDRCRRL